MEYEFRMFLLKDNEDTLKLIKSLATAQVMLHFEAGNEEGRLKAKGAAEMLKMIKEAHLAAWEIHSRDIDIDEKMIYVTNNRTGKKESFIWKHIDGRFNTLLYNKEEK